MTHETGNTSSDRVAAQRARMEASLARRNRTEFIAGSVAIAFLIVSGILGLIGAADTPDTLAALGLLVVAFGLAMVLWRLRLHIIAQRREAADRNSEVALAAGLRRERDLLRSVWSWYIGPMLPGLALVWGAMVAGGSVGTALIGAAISIAALAWIARANRRAAAAFDDQLQALGSPAH